MNVIPYGRHFVDEDDIQSVVDVLKSTHLTQGEKVREFEEEFARFTDANYSIAVSNGTTALHLCVMALGLEAGDKVLTTSNTFVASSNCVLYASGKIDFVDIDPESYLFDLDKLEEKLKSSPDEYKGIVGVDFAGYPIDMERLSKIAKKYGLWIIEDACHAIGGEFKNSQNEVEKVGSGKYADLTIFSFHPVKHITAGEGGIITTRNKELYEKVNLLRSHGITKNSEEYVGEDQGGWYYEMQELGYNYRLSDINCALVLSQLKKIDKNLERRREVASIYNEKLSGIKQVQTPTVGPRFSNAYHLYVIRVEDRKKLYDFLRQKNIHSQVLYIPVHQQPFYQKLGSWDEVLPETNKYYKECLALPMFPTLTNQEVDYVVDSIKEFYTEGA
tara:strand:- start:13022 stop:14185 length:1164 start_codon:yes stop_codon:yes gene_type:complete